MPIRVISALLGPLQVKPVLLHGDLWVLLLIHKFWLLELITTQSGNTGTDATTGEPVIFDPSSLYGHNEAEYVFQLIAVDAPEIS